MRLVVVLALAAGGLWAVGGCGKEDGGIEDQPKPDINRQNPGRPDPSTSINGTAHKTRGKGD